MKEQTNLTTSTAAISTTDLMVYDGPYETDWDKFRNMSGLAQGAIIVGGVVAVGAIGYGIYKGVKYLVDKNNNQYIYDEASGQYYKALPTINNKVNFTGNVTPGANGGIPNISFQGSSVPVNAPQQAQSQLQPVNNIPQPIYAQKVVDANGNVNVVPIQSTTNPLVH